MKTLLIQIATYALMALIAALYIFLPSPLPSGGQLYFTEILNDPVHIFTWLLGRGFRAALAMVFIAVPHRFGAWAGTRHPPSEHTRPFDHDLNRLVLVAAFSAFSISTFLSIQHGHFHLYGLLDPRTWIVYVLTGGALAGAFIMGYRKGGYLRATKPDSNPTAQPRPWSR
jgi:hypothetical protein